MLEGRLHIICFPAQEAEVSGCSAMRHVLVGGEALPPALAVRFQERWSNAHLHNAYGPTETTVDATGEVALFKAIVHMLWFCAHFMPAYCPHDIATSPQGGAVSNTYA